MIFHVDIFNIWQLQTYQYCVNFFPSCKEKQIVVNRFLLSYDFNCRCPNWIKLKSYCGRLWDICKYLIIVLRINMVMKSGIYTLSQQVISCDVVAPILCGLKFASAERTDVYQRSVYLDAKERQMSDLFYSLRNPLKEKYSYTANRHGSLL